MATMAQAIRLALHYGETHLGVKDIFGEDVGAPLGGVFTCTQGLKTAWNTPLDERGIVGCAYGLALAGCKPVAEIQFVDYIFNAIDLLKICGNTRWASNNDWPVQMVLMTPVGAGIHGSIYHSHSFESIASHLPGWKIVMPSTPYDAYGLLIAAIKDPDPVLYLMPKALLRVSGVEKLPGEPEDPKELSKKIDAPIGDRTGWKPDWPVMQDPELPIGKAKVVRSGKQMTVVSYGRHLPICQQAAEKLAPEGIDPDILDLRTIFPYDLNAILESVRKTGRLLIVNEDTEVTNFGEHLLRRVIDEAFYSLEVKPILLAGANTPGVALAENLEEVCVPQISHVMEAMRELAHAVA